MLVFTIRGLWSRKRRLISSFLAVFLGVAFLTGAMVLGNTLQSSISSFFGHAYAGTDVVVRSATSVNDQPGSQRGMIDGTVAGRVAAVPGVAVAEPVIQGIGQLLQKNGQTIKVLGPRTAGNWIADPGLNPYAIAEGRAPARSGEVVIDKKVAKDGHLNVGDTTVLLTPQRVQVTVVGLVRFGGQDAFGGTSFTGMTLGDAQRYLTDRPGRITSVSVRATPGIAPQTLAQRIAGVLPANTEAITGKKLTKEQLASVDTFLQFVRFFLLTFAAVALLVGIFGIHNTFGIIVAQRTRESALLRALGASRRQLMTAVALEGVVLGLVAALAGAAGGVAFAAGLQTLFVSFGFGLKGTSLALSATPFLIAVPVGTAVTVGACLVPALRAARTPPIAALREASAERADMSPARAAIGAAFLLVSASLLVWAATAHITPGAAVGTVLALAALIILGPVAVRPIVSLMSIVASRSIAATLARQNALRNPRRTAGAASALMIGVGVVTLFTILAASLEQTTSDNVSKSFAGDLVVNAGSGSSVGFGPDLAKRIAALPQVSGAAGMGSGFALIHGKPTSVHVADPATLAAVLNIPTKAGSLDQLAAGQIAVSQNTGLTRGAPLQVRYADGTSQTVTVGVVYQPLEAVGDYLWPRSSWNVHDPRSRDQLVFVTLRAGQSVTAAKTAIEDAAKPSGAPSVQTRGEYVDGQTATMRNLLTVVYVMLALAILIALMGIANTLSLAIHERTRELGLLRALGATRQQTRSLIRWEALLIALFGTTGGLVLGGALAWAFVTVGSNSFAAPPVQLTVIAAVGALAGLLAALYPAHRASRIPIINALAVA